MCRRRDPNLRSDFPRPPPLLLAPHRFLSSLSCTRAALLPFLRSSYQPSLLHLLSVSEGARHRVGSCYIHSQTDARVTDKLAVRWEWLSRLSVFSFCPPFFVTFLLIFFFSCRILWKHLRVYKPVSGRLIYSSFCLCECQRGSVAFDWVVTKQPLLLAGVSQSIAFLWFLNCSLWPVLPLPWQPLLWTGHVTVGPFPSVLYCHVVRNKSLIDIWGFSEMYVFPFSLMQFLAFMHFYGEAALNSSAILLRWIYASQLWIDKEHKRLPH